MFSRNLLKVETAKGVAKLVSKLSNRSIWGYVAIAFNQVDKERLDKVGPDRLCAEWLLKNGGGVRFKELPNRLITDYNILPPESSNLHIKVADASDSSIMKIGLEHFKGCRHIDTVILHNCKHLEEDGLEGLTYLVNTLNHLKVSGCYNLTDASLKVIRELKNLNCLFLSDLRYVKNLNEVVKEIHTDLPECNIKVE